MQTFLCKKSFRIPVVEETAEKSALSKVSKHFLLNLNSVDIVAFNIRVVEA